jgi:hypothetical protein
MIVNPLDRALRTVSDRQQVSDTVRKEQLDTGGITTAG